jgi:hypothetical protein
MNNEPMKSDSIELFKHADEKIDKLSKEISDLLQKDLSLTLKIDRLQDRIDNGVSVTGQKTLEKVTGLVTQVATFATALEKQEIMIKNHEDSLGRINRGIFWLAFCGVGGGLIILVFNLIKAGHP